MQLEQHNKMALNLVCVVCDREKREKALAVLEGQKSFFNLGLLGKGTANSRTLSYLGLGQTDKTVFFSIMPQTVAQEVLAKMDEVMELGVPGNGIAFSAPISEGCYHKPVQFGDWQDGGNEMQQTSTHDLIMVVVNRGYTEEVMDVARAAGARGGTVLHARGCGMTGAEKFFGVTIQPEKELIMIVAGNQDSCGIMAEIADKAGPGTDASAVSFSMPLTDVRGLGGKAMADEANKG